MYRMTIYDGQKNFIAKIEVDKSNIIASPPLLFWADWVSELILRHLQKA